MPSSHRVPHLDALFQPLRIGNVTLKNRIVMAAMVAAGCRSAMRWCSSRLAGKVVMLTGAPTHGPT